MRTHHHDCLGGCGREGNTPYTTTSGRYGMVCSHCLVTSEGGLNDQQFRAGRESRVSNRAPSTGNWYTD